MGDDDVTGPVPSTHMMSQYQVTRLNFGIEYFIAQVVRFDFDVCAVLSDYHQLSK